MVVHVSETYTAVYAREGDEWVAEIAEAGLSTRGANVAEVRTQIREALATQLATTPATVAVVDQFAMPAPLRAVQSEVRATRSVEEKARMAASMTEAKTAKEWALELELAQRAPAAVKWLSGLEGELDVDEMCFAISVAEQMGGQGFVEENADDDPQEDARSERDAAGEP